MRDQLTSLGQLHIRWDLDDALLFTTLELHLKPQESLPDLYGDGTEPAVQVQKAAAGAAAAVADLAAATEHDVVNGPYG